jgi:hypothetical protein
MDISYSINSPGHAEQLRPQLSCRLAECVAISIHLREQRLVVFEFKRWTNAPDVAKGMLTDLERVRSVQVQPAWVGDVQIKQRFGVIATTVWSWYNGNRSGTRLIESSRSSKKAV